MNKSVSILILICLSAQMFAQPGTLDSSFGLNGQVYNDFGDDNGRCRSAVLQKDGKIVCVGGGNKKFADTTLGGFLVLRYLDNGMPDESFGEGGRIVTPFTNGGGEANAVAIQADGKIVVAGYGGLFNSNAYNDIFIVRYHPDGSLDAGFGDSGVVRTDFGLSEDEYAAAITIQPDGKLVVAGNYTDQYFLTLRYNTDGSLDESFGDGGKVIAPWGGLSRAYAIALQPDGKIITAGFYGAEFAAIARNLPDGRPDSSFGNNGVTYNFGAYIYNALCIQPDGKILAGGQTEDGIVGDMVIVRYNSDGKPDSSFGINSAVKPAFSLPASVARSLQLFEKDKIMVAGSAFKGFVPRFNQVVSLFLSINDGALDTTYGENGYATFSLDGIGTGTGFLTNDGDVIIQAGNGNYDGVYLFRFNGFPQQPTPIARIKRWLHKHGITWDDCPPSICDKITGYAVQRSSNNVNWSTVFSSRRSANSQQPSANSYADPSPLPGTNYYRLEATSADGAVAYSNVIAISNELSAISISPNPAKSVLRIEGLPSTQKTKIMVVDLGGNVALSLERSAFSSEVAGMRYEVSANGQQLKANSPSPYSLNIASLKPGNYLLRIESEGNVITKQFIKE